MRRLLLFSGFLLLAGCLRTPTLSALSPTLQRIEKVPLRMQDGRSDCGAAVLSSLLAHRGKDIAVAEIDAEIRHPKLGGTLLPDMENYARKQGFATRSGRGTEGQLRREIENGRPVVIPIRNGPSILASSHYILLYGYDKGLFLAIDPRSGPSYIRSADLDVDWARMNRLYLLLE